MFLLNLVVFFFNDTATTEIYTLSLHDALPISIFAPHHPARKCSTSSGAVPGQPPLRRASEFRPDTSSNDGRGNRSEEHTSELQSRLQLVCRLLLEKKTQTLSSIPFRYPLCEML